MKKLLTILFSLFVVFSYAQIDLEKQTNITEQINNPDGIFKPIIYSTVDTTVTGDFTIPVANIVTITSFCDDGVDNTISLPTPVDSLKGNIVEVTHLEPSDDPNRTTTVETDGTSYHIYDNFTGDTLTFFNIYQSGQTVRFTLKEIEGVLRWEAVNLSPFVYGDKELTAIGNIRQGIDGSLYAYDNSVLGERKVQYQYTVDSVQEILSMNLELGDRVKVKGTGAEYLLQADSVSGYAVDSIAVIPSGNKYAVLDSKYFLSVGYFGATGDGTETTGTDNTAAFQKAIDFQFTRYKGGKILIPADTGYYRLSKIYIKEGIFLEGVGNSYPDPRGSDLKPVRIYITGDYGLVIGHNSYSGDNDPNRSWGVNIKNLSVYGSENSKAGL